MSCPPLLLILFKRHVSLRAQLEILRAVRPEKVYVFADGPRRADDVADCAKARAVLDGIDWPCQVRTKLMDTNLGCGRGPATAMDWFFENESEGIILEDDLLPHPDFFRFCAEMLERYRDDVRVMEVSGTNRLGHWGQGLQSYYFSVWGSECGWATWRRAWKYYDYTIQAWADPATRVMIKALYRHPVRVAFFSRILDQTFAGGSAVNWWDYQWALAKNLNHGLAVVPTTTLVRNVGCDRYSTHDRVVSHTFAASGELKGLDFPLRHPDRILPDRNYDDALLRLAMPLRHYLSSLLPTWFKRGVKRVFRPQSMREAVK